MAQIAGQSPCDDIAVLKIDHIPDTATQPPLGDSSTVAVTDSVYVIGYPGSLASMKSEYVVFTQGSIRSTHVHVNQIGGHPTYRDTIQHSATVADELLNGDGGDKRGVAECREVLGE